MKKLFTNDTFFLIMVLCTICEIVFAIISITVYHNSDQACLVLIIRVLCVFVLFISYKKHNKNVMKGMMGALLMAHLITAILRLSNDYFAIESIFSTIFAILATLLFINHFIINSSHKSNPVLITISQIILILLVLNNTVWGIAWMIEDNSVLNCIISILDIIGYMGMTAVVVCVESRLDAYRLDREKAGWTEEKGYPEGYIRQKDRK